MKKDKLLVTIIGAMFVLFMVFFGIINLLQTHYNLFVVILLVCCVLLMVTVWRKGVDIQQVENMKAFDEE